MRRLRARLAPELRCLSRLWHRELRRALVPALDRVTNESDQLYGARYWNEHQVELGFPPIEVRARTDLAERCQYWLAQVLKYQVPPGRALEIGCAHGGFVKLLGLAGFEALGIEMSPEVVSRSRERFAIDVLQGPLEEMTAELGPFDLVAMFDVVEHLPDPVSTLRIAASYTKPAAILVIQTPKHDDVRDPRWPMYVSPEHLFLFSSAGLKRLLAQCGFQHVVFERPMFGYDMFAFASRQPFAANTPSTVERRLLATPDGRMALAMQDLYRDSQFNPAFQLSAEHGTKALGSSFLRSLWRSMRRRLGTRTK